MRVGVENRSVMVRKNENTNFKIGIRKEELHIYRTPEKTS